VFASAKRYEASAKRYEQNKRNHLSKIERLTQILKEQNSKFGFNTANL
jgi:hypothetical protein